VSTVRTSASNPDAPAREIISFSSPRSRHTYTWNQFVPVGAASATSSIEYVPRVDRV
jgi:hypothetical protein